MTEDQSPHLIEALDSFLGECQTKQLAIATRLPRFTF